MPSTPRRISDVPFSYSFLTLFLLSLVCVGCNEKEKDNDRRRETQSEFAGRPLVAITSEYVLYASESSDSGQIMAWMDNEIRRFCASYGFQQVPQGMVIAIESNKEPSQNVRAWVEKNPEPERSIIWASLKELEIVGGLKQRPYGLRSTPYFTTSHHLPVEYALGNSLIKKSNWIPSWICFVTTNVHFEAQFQHKVSGLATIEVYTSDDMPLTAKLRNMATVAVMRTLRPMILKRLKATDSKLMNLQRRETLYRTLILSIKPDESEALLDKLQSTIDKAWKEIWFERPRW